MHPNQAAPQNMSFMDNLFAAFAENISEGKRWNGRTQSTDSWSTAQLGQDLRLHGDRALKLQDASRAETVQDA
jgi:hypothetical protein